MFKGTAEDRSLNLWVQFQVEVRDATIEQARFLAFGCPHSLAAADLVASELEGKPVEALTNIDFGEIARRIDLPREKTGNLLRIEDALAACYTQAISMEQE